MALDGHMAAQVPQPLHNTALTTDTFHTGSIEGAPKGHTSTHMPHPAHSSASTTAVADSTGTVPRMSGMSDEEAAALAWEIVSEMSLGPWQQPAKKTPSMAVSTGRSLGCASRKKPSAERGNFKSPAMSWA